jgi:hypothetical protein
MRTKSEIESVLYGTEAMHLVVSKKMQSVRDSGEEPSSDDFDAYRNYLETEACISLLEWILERDTPGAAAVAKFGKGMTRHLAELN